MFSSSFQTLGHLYLGQQAQAQHHHDGPEGLQLPWQGLDQGGRQGCQGKTIFLRQSKFLLKMQSKAKSSLSHKFRDIFALCWVTLSLRLKKHVGHLQQSTGSFFLSNVQYQVLVVLRKMVFPRKRQPHYPPLGDLAGFQHKSSCSLFLDTLFSFTSPFNNFHSFAC